MSGCATGCFVVTSSTYLRIRGLLVRVFGIAYPLDQAGQHAADFVQSGIEGLVLFFREQSEVACEQQKILQFARRSRREIQELAKLGLATASATLGDICGHRG